MQGARGRRPARGRGSRPGSGRLRPPVREQRKPSPAKPSPAKLPPRPDAHYLRELDRRGKLARPRLRVAALLGYRPAVEVWKELEEKTPFASYAEWSTQETFLVNLGASEDFELIGLAVLGLARQVARRHASRDRRVQEALKRLELWARTRSEPSALEAQGAIAELSPRGKPGTPAAGVLVAALAVPALLCKVYQARDASWHAYVKATPAAKDLTKREWLRRLRQDAAKLGLAACCKEAARFLPEGAIDRIVRDTIMDWALPRLTPRSKR